MSSEQEIVETEWPTDPDSYHLLVQIGKGAFATVWKATALTRSTFSSEELNHNASEESSDTAVTSPKHNSHDCAVKVLNLDHVDTNLSEIRLEVQAMRLSSHPNILAMHTAFVADTHLWLVTPLMCKGSSVHCLQMARRLLRRQVKQAIAAAQESSSSGIPPRTIPPLQDHILYILHETVLGLQYIHENGFIHRDVKGGNIFLDGDGGVKIGDFGVSGWLVQGGRQSTKAQTFVGTPCWMAPEVMEQVHGYDTSADIWSLGITALELAKGYAPYAKYPPMKVLILTIQENPPSLDSYVEDDAGGDDDVITQEAFTRPFVQLVDVCLQKTPSRRPNCQELLQRYLPMDEAQRQERRTRIVEEICNLVPDVGSSGSSSTSSSARQRAFSTSGGSDNNATTSMSIALATEKDRPPGTTWVFADGSSTSQTAVHSSAMISSEDTISQPPTSPAAAVEDVLEVLDEFGKQTGGEHYTRKASNRRSSAAGHTRHPDDDLPLSSLHQPQSSYQQQQEQLQAQLQQQQQQSANESSDHGDDLSAFMDEFELRTAGEDFRRDEE